MQKTKEKEIIMTNEISESWLEYRRLVIEKLECLDEAVDEIRKHIIEMEKSVLNNEGDMKDLINEEINNLKTKLDNIISTNKDDISEKVHKLDIRVSELQVKVMLIGAGISAIVGFGKDLLEWVMK